MYKKTRTAERARTADILDAPGRLAQRLRDYKAVNSQRRGGTGNGSLNVLHLLSQQPGKTGSGVALLALVRLGAEAGWRQHAVVGLPGEEPLPDIPPLAPADVTPVRFDRPSVPFALPGMSDIMPYVSTRFSKFTPEMLEGYLQAQGSSFTVMTGNGGQLLPGLQLGVRGGIVAVGLFAAGLCVDVYDGFRSGDLQRATIAQDRCGRLLRARRRRAVG